MAKIEVNISSQVNEIGKSELLLRISVNRNNRFRVKSGIYVYPERFKSGVIKPQRSEDKEERRKQMLDADEKLSRLRSLIISSCEGDPEITKEKISIIIDKFHNPDKYKEETTEKKLSTRFTEYIEQCYKDNIFGHGRKKHYDVLDKELNRFLIINNLTDIKASDFTCDKIVLFRDFLFNEHNLVKKNRGLYTGMNERNTPTNPRNQNTVATKLKKIQAFFNELEDKDEIPVSPFRKLGKQRKKAMMREQYDEPIYLTEEEFLLLKKANVPKSLQESKDAFLLQCSLGCRISDFQALTLENIGTEDEIPYIHYLPQKTMNEGDTRKEVHTPLMRFSLDIIKKHKFIFPILRNITGERGYNDKIKELLKYCNINRLVAVFNNIEGKNEYKPICDIASSKLARKTHVDMMNKVQINQYAAGLHKSGSSAVKRYTSMNIKDRFILMCAAFGEEEYRVDSKLNIKKEELVNVIE